MSKRIQKSGIVPNFVPRPYSRGKYRDAYLRGWSHGHGIACHNVPRIGEELFTDGLGRVTVDADNIAEVHATVCHEAADNSRCFSPFEFTAAEFNRDDDSDALWEAFEAGTADAIAADLRGYTYGE